MPEPALDVLSPRVDSAQATIAFEPLEQPAIALADARVLIHVFVNLLKNALEACASMPEPKPKPNIHLRTETRECDVVVEITDNGVGLTGEVAERIFDRGFSTKGTGRGIGLSIARESVEVFGGELKADNAPGGGALFRVVLPAVGTKGGLTPQS